MGFGSLEDEDDGRRSGCGGPSGRAAGGPAPARGVGPTFRRVRTGARSACAASRGLSFGVSLGLLAAVLLSGLAASLSIAAGSTGAGASGDPTAASTVGWIRPSARPVDGTLLSGSRVADAGALEGRYRVTHLTARTGRRVRLGEPIAAASEVTIGPDGTLSATLGCNALEASLSLSGDRVSVSRIATTGGFCRGPVGEAERNLVSALRSARFVEPRPDRVGLLDAAGVEIATFERRS